MTCIIIKVISLDLPGHGETTTSEEDDLSIEGQADAVYDFVTHAGLTFFEQTTGETVNCEYVHILTLVMAINFERKVDRKIVCSLLLIPTI